MSCGEGSMNAPTVNILIMGILMEFGKELIHGLIKKVKTEDGWIYVLDVEVKKVIFRNYRIYWY